MSLINKRAFGADMPVKVKKILEARQRAAEGKKSPNEEIKGSDYRDKQSAYHTYGELLGDTTFDGEAELASRTPFARMWTAINILKKSENREYLTNSDDFTLSLTKSVMAQAKARQKEKARLQAELHPASIINWDPVKEQFYIQTDDVSELNKPLDTKIYIVNQHDTNTLRVNESLQEASDYEVLFPTEHNVAVPDQETGYYMYYPKTKTNPVAYNDPIAYAGSVGQNNQFLKPGAGITSVTSETEGALGQIKKTTVNFEVHNFHDFDKIYNRFFLKPGAQIFVDFGWANLAGVNEDIHALQGNYYHYKFGSGYYDPKDFLDITKEYNGISKGIQSKLFDTDGFVAENQGLMDTCVGLVTDYESKIKENGSVQCSLTITSKNAALMNYNLEEGKVIKKIGFLLDHLITFESLYKASGLTERTFLADSIPDYNSSTSNIKDWQITISALARRSFGLEVDLTPGRVSGSYYSDPLASEVNQACEQKFGSSYGCINITNLSDSSKAECKSGYCPGSSNIQCCPLGGDARSGYTRGGAIDRSVEYGIFLTQHPSEQSYISLGLFEDRVINNELGFGLDASSIISEHSNFEISLNSQDSFTMYNEFLKQRQSIIVQEESHEEPPVFLYPENWDSSYNVKNDKQPHDADENGWTFASYIRVEGSAPKYQEYNKMRNKTGYTETDKSVNRIPLREIFIRCDVIKKAFETSTSVRLALQQIFDRIYENSGEIIDLRLVSAPGEDNSLAIVDYNYMGLETSDLGVYSNLFTFDVMSKGSIVKGYDVNLKIPDGDVGNMYAIQGLTADNQMFPISAQTDEYMALHGLTSTFGPRGGETEYYMTYMDELIFSSEKLKDRTSHDSTLHGLYGNLVKDLDLLNADPPLDTRYDGIDINSDSWKNWLAEVVKEKKDIKAKASSSTEESKPYKESYELMQKRTAELYALMNIYSATNYSDYYLTLAKDDYFTGRSKKSTARATPLPITATITIYGISSIQPGDIFRLNYLPEVYRAHVYFQCIKVKHDINSDGWYTTLETQFRIRHDSITAREIYKPYSDIILSPEVLTHLGPPITDLSAMTEVVTIKLDEIITPTDVLKKGDGTVSEQIEDIIEAGQEIDAWYAGALTDWVEVEFLQRDWGTRDNYPTGTYFHNDTETIFKTLLEKAKPVELPSGLKFIKHAYWVTASSLLPDEGKAIKFPRYYMYSESSGFIAKTGYPVVRGLNVNSQGILEECTNKWDRLLLPNPNFKDKNCISSFYSLDDYPAKLDPFFSEHEHAGIDAPSFEKDLPAGFKDLIGTFPGFHRDTASHTRPMGVTLYPGKKYLLVYNEVWPERPMDFWILIPIHKLGTQTGGEINFIQMADYNIHFQNFSRESLIQSYLDENYSHASGVWGEPINANPCCWRWDGIGQPGDPAIVQSNFNMIFNYKDVITDAFINRGLDAIVGDRGKWVYDENQSGNPGSPLISIGGEPDIPCNEECPYFDPYMIDFFDNYTAPANSQQNCWDPNLNDGTGGFIDCPD